MRFMVLLVTVSVVYLRALPLSYRSPLGVLQGRGGRRIFVKKTWIDITRHEARGIVAELTDEEAQHVQQALHAGRAEEAQDLIAAAALRYFRKQGREV